MAGAIPEPHNAFNLARNVLALIAAEHVDGVA